MKMQSFLLRAQPSLQRRAIQLSLAKNLNLFAPESFRAASAANVSASGFQDQQQRYRSYSSTGALLSPATPPKDPPEEGSVPTTFYVPKAERSERNVFLLDVALGETRLQRNDRVCPTRELNFTETHWRKHKSPYRRLRHIINLPKSSPFQRLAFPDLFGVATIGSALIYYNEVIAGGAAEAMLTMSPGAFAGATTAIGLLAGFKLNASYGRYEECRIFWGDINNTIRDLAGQTCMWMKDDVQKNRMLKICQAFPLSHMFHVNAKGCHHNITSKDDAKSPYSKKDRVHAEFMAELRDIYNDGTFEDDFQRISRVKYNGGNTPLEVLTMMRETIAGSVGTVDSIYVRELDEQVQRLCAAYGASERVLRTPLPTGFTRHSSRLLFLWSHSLPFALYGACGPLGVLPASLITTFAVCGIEDIGVQLEEPFDILPMRQYSDGMYDGINAIKKNFNVYKIGHDERAVIKTKEPKKEAEPTVIEVTPKTEELKVADASASK